MVVPSNLCRLCMSPSAEMTQIFQESSDSSAFSMKIMSTLGVEVHKIDQLPKQMCTPCVYQLEKFYIFRKLSRKTDSKYRSFVRKVKSKRITLLEELSDDDDDGDSATGDADQAFVQEYERNMVQDQLKAQLGHQVTTGRQQLLQRIKKTLYETIDNLVDEEYVTEQVVTKKANASGMLPRFSPRKASPKTPSSSSSSSPARPPLPRYSTRKKQSSIADKVAEETEDGDKTTASVSVSGDDEEDEEAMDEDQEELEEYKDTASVTITGDDDHEEEEDYMDDEFEEGDYEEIVPVTESESFSAVVLKSGLIHKCSSCGRKFSSLEKLEKHQVYHKTEKNVCPDCGKCFSSSGSLFRHAKIHSAVKAFTCDVCQKGFTQKGSMLRHALVHQKERPFACTTCDRSFSQRSLLVDHVAKAHSVSNVTYIFSCNECPKIFRYSSGLSRHALSHTGKPFSCDQCQKQLSDYSSLQRHIKSMHD